MEQNNNNYDRMNSQVASTIFKKTTGYIGKKGIRTAGKIGRRDCPKFCVNNLPRKQ